MTDLYTIVFFKQTKKYFFEDIFFFLEREINGIHTMRTIVLLFTVVCVVYFTEELLFFLNMMEIQIYCKVNEYQYYV